MQKKYIQIVGGLLFLVQMLFLGGISAQTYTITTVAGNGTSGFSGDSGAAASAELNAPQGIYAGPGGNVYFGDGNNNRIRRINPSGIILTIAGNGTGKYSGDGGPAIISELYNPIGVMGDNDGNLFIADEFNNRIRKVNAFGTISTIAGSGKLSYSGDGSQATNAQLFFPLGIAIDDTGNIYIADCFNQRIRKVTPAGIITTIAGNGTAGYSGDGFQATNAELSFPTGVALDASGNIYIADAGNNRIRIIIAGGVIKNFAGDGWAWYYGDGGAATSAGLNDPTGVAIDGSGNVYIADQHNNRIRVVNTLGNITTYAGNGTAGYSGNGQIATSAELNHPAYLTTDANNNVYFSDNNNNCVRRISPSDTIYAFAGNGTAGYSGDTGPAANAKLNNPLGVYFGNGNIYIDDAGNSRVRQVNTADTITTIAGNGIAGFSGDYGPAASAELRNPAGVVTDGSGNIYISDDYNQRIRIINTAGIIKTYAGNGVVGYSGDGMQADSSQLFFPAGVAHDIYGNTYIADCFNHRIRKVNPNGIITTIAGDGIGGYNGDNIQATNAELYFPTDVAVDDSGNVFVADDGNNRIRKISHATGKITTIAGIGGAGGYSGDNGPATTAQLNSPTGVALDGFGNIYIADNNNSRIRKINRAGIITTIAGKGVAGYYGDNGAAKAAELYNPWGVSVNAEGFIYLTDTKNNRVRKLTPQCTLSLSTTDSNVTCIGAHNGKAFVTVTSGSPPYTYSWLPYGGTSSEATGLSAGTYTVSVMADTCLGSATVTIKRPPYTINTIAGIGLFGYSGDNGQATAAELNVPCQITLDNSGNLYIADRLNNRIRKVTPAGIITTVAGNGYNSNVLDSGGYSGDGGAATAAELKNPTGVALGKTGNLYIADEINNCVRMVDKTTGNITTVAGNTDWGWSGDNGPATAAEMKDPDAIAFDKKGDMYIVDAENNRVRMVDTGDTITTIAGNGAQGFSGDNGPATAAEFYTPFGICLDSAGDIYIADYFNNRIRMINHTNGYIYTVAGVNDSGFSGDGGPATAAELYHPAGIVADGAGDIYFSDQLNHRIRVIDLNGYINTIAGNGIPGFLGDSGIATRAELAYPYGLAIDSSFNIYEGELVGGRIRKLYACPFCNLKANAAVYNPVSCNNSSNGSIIAIPQGGNSPYTYSWSPYSGTSDTLSALNMGTYTVAITDTTGCTATAFVNLTGTVVNASISGPDSICIGDVVSLTASGGDTYLWNNGNTNTTITINPSADSIYSVAVWSGSCLDTTSHEVFVGTDGSICAVKFYSGFTPNGDGYNDYWQIDNIELFPDNDVKIFNRWGNLVWSANGYNNNDVSWKGQNQRGVPLPDGTYFYLVKINTKTYKGWVQLTR